MPDSSGVASRLPASVAVAGELIDATKHNLTQDDNIAMLNNRVQKDGSTSFTAPQTGVAGTASVHLVTKGQMEAITTPLVTFKDGQKWLPVPGFPLTTSANQTFIAIPGLDNAKKIKITFLNIKPTAVTAFLQMRISANGSNYVTINNFYQTVQYNFIGNTPTAAIVPLVIGGNSVLLTSGDDQAADPPAAPINGELEFYKPAVSARHQFKASASYETANLAFNHTDSYGRLNTASEVRIIQIFFSSGDIAAGAFVHAEYLL
jgi:hypothetical protein